MTLAVTWLRLAVGGWTLATFIASNPSGAQELDLRVDGARLNQTMATMKTFGGNAGGGSDRVAFSEHNREALEYLAGLMRDAGMETYVDFAGNLVGRSEGSEPGAKPIITGSHVDTVPNGGHYDGIVGVMSAIEVARTLRDNEFRLAHPLEIAVWSNEEGGKTGSRSMNGSVDPSEMELPSLGDRTLGEGIRFLGGDPARLSENVRQPGDIASYIELHVEQGGILDREGIDIGVVQGIVGIKRWNVTVDGFANHAGTTPMDQRRDALYAAAILITNIRRILLDEDGRHVGTIGRIRAHPGAPNVIPGQVTMSLEIRDLRMRRIDNIFERIADTAEAIGERTDTTVTFEQFYESPAAETDERISGMVENAVRLMGLSSLAMPSGAGHDAQSFKGIAPIGMIFVPSRDGISHAPAEFTSEQQITNGANVLLHTIIAIDGLLGVGPR